jgi:hypothetical protein
MTLAEQLHIVAGVPVKFFGYTEGRAPVRFGVVSPISF